MRIGLAGAGRIGAFHAGILSGLPAVDSVVVADADAARAREVARRLHLQAADRRGICSGWGSTRS